MRSTSSLTCEAPEGEADAAVRRVAVLVGSTRSARICLDIAEWAASTLGEGSALEYDLVDLADVNLPLLDEPLKAALGDYRHEHTKAWSRTITGFDGFVFVVPQYNWGYPAAFKNALDYLYHEWRGKPATSITYGTHGGGKAADQVRQVLDGLRMEALPTRLEAIITDDDLDENWQLKDLEATLSPCRDRLRRIDTELTERLIPETPRSAGEPL